MSIRELLSSYSKENIYPFHMPGHKRRLYPVPELKSFYEMDITEIDGFDNLHDARGILKEAQERAARVFSSDNTYFLVNGTTSGILAAIYGTVREGDTVIMARNCHKCVYNAVMLSGAKAEYIYPEVEPILCINSGISPDKVREKLSNVRSEDGYDKDIAVVITSPTYEGVVSDIQSIADICHEYDACLIVDAAHGAHLGFSNDFPESAIKLGADITVTSIHKTLPAPTQVSLLHMAEGVQSAKRVEKMLSVFQTSSPSYPLMAAIDACVELIDTEGSKLFAAYARRLNNFYEQAQSLTNIGVLTKDILTCRDSYDFDYGKIVIYDRSGRFSGKQLYNILLDNYKLQPEMAAGGYVLLMTSLADDDKGINRLTDAIKEIDVFINAGDKDTSADRNIFRRIYDYFAGRKIRKILFDGSESVNDLSLISKMAFSVSDSEVEEEVFGKEGSVKSAMWQEGEYIPVELSEGRQSCDYISFYPPGIPVIVPGEIISAQKVDMILSGREKDLAINGLNENGEIRVLWEKSSI